MSMWRGVAKYFIFSVNLLFTIIALAVIAVGAFTHFKFSEIAETIPSLTEDILEYLQYFPFVIIAFGVIVFVIAFFGCCGASSQIKCLLITYTVFLSVLAAVMVAGGVMLLITNFKELMETRLTDAFGKEDGVFQVYEALFKCCGTDGPDSYDIPDNLVPYTCCKDNTGQESLTCSKTEAFAEGCVIKVGEWVAMAARNLAIALFVVGGFEVLLLGITIYLIMTIKPNKKVQVETTKET